MSKLRTGRTKSILESSIDSALLAVEVYNKPRTTFRAQSYISLMIIAWTSLFHAYFRKTIGEIYFYKEENGRYKKIDGDRRAWEIGTCIREYGKLSEPVKANLTLMINLRNKIEHRSCTLEGMLDSYIFGECQSLLYNYENTLVQFFGQEYAINENLVYSLQFSQMRTGKQVQANRQILSNEIRRVKEYIDKYRTELSAEVYDSQEYSIKLIQIPKISNTNRGELAIEFINWSQLSDEDKARYEKVTALIKDKRVLMEAVNAGRLLASNVMRQVQERTGINLDYSSHTNLCYLFRIRSRSATEGDPLNTNTKFCHYDHAHKSHVYNPQWVDLVCNVLGTSKCSKSDFRNMANEGFQLKVSDYEPRTIGANGGI
jgi:hypothetical protein